MSDWQTPDPETVPLRFGPIEGWGYSYAPGQPPAGAFGRLENYWDSHAFPTGMSGIPTTSLTGVVNLISATSNAPNVSYWDVRRVPGEFRPIIAAPVVPEWARGRPIEFEEPFGEIISGTATVRFTASVLIESVDRKLNPAWVNKPFMGSLLLSSSVDFPSSGLRPNLTDMSRMQGYGGAGDLIQDVSPSLEFGRAVGFAEDTFTIPFEPEDFRPDSPYTPTPGAFQPWMQLIPDMDLFHQTLPLISLEAPVTSQGGWRIVASVSLDSGEVTYQPPRWRLLHSGQWRTRQRQGVGADGWPIRQRQNYGATGSWALRQKQNRA